jgi:hypothetical protein
MRTRTLAKRALATRRPLVVLTLLGISLSACAALPPLGLRAAVRVDGRTTTTSVAAQPLTLSSVATGLPAMGKVLGRFSPVYMGTHWNFTQAQAVTLATQFDVIAAQANVFPRYIAAMKAANPNLKIVGYLNGMFDLTSGGTAYPITWYSHDRNGNRIRSTFGNYLLNPANPSWAASVAQQCRGVIGKSHYDGCFIDTLGTAPLDAGYCSGFPVNPATRQVWTQTQWIAATSSIARAVQVANPAAVIMDNGLADGAKYYNPTGSTEPLVAATHVGMVELWLRSNGTPANRFRTEAQWLQDVNMIVNAQAQGFWVATTTKLWVSASSSQQTQWQKYTLASFLLAANGKAYLSFMPTSSNAGLTFDSAWLHINIGTPSGAFSKVGGVYRRTFTNGIAAVNPTGSSVSISLGGTYTNLAGQRVTSETLPPNSGDVFHI